MCLWNPIFLIACNTNVWGASLALVLSEFVPMSALVISLFCGRFSTKLSWGLFIRKFNPETYNALSVAVSALFMNLSTTLPAVVMQKWVSNAAKAIGEFNDVMALWNILNKLYNLAICIVLAFNTAYLPPTSYACGSGRYKRIIHLSFHAFWIMCVWTALVSIIMCTIPDKIVSLWDSTEGIKYWARRIIPNNFYTMILCPMRMLMTSFLQAVKRPILAGLVSLLTSLVSQPILSTIFYQFYKTDPAGVFKAYIVNDVWSFVVSVCFAAYPMYQLFKKDKSNQECADCNEAIPSA